MQWKHNLNKKSSGYDHDKKRTKKQWKTFSVFFTKKKIDPIENICGIAKYESMINMNLKIYESATYFFFIIDQRIINNRLI